MYHHCNVSGNTTLNGTVNLGGSAIITDTSSYAAFRKILKITDIAVADDVAFMNDLIKVHLQVVYLVVIISLLSIGVFLFF